MRTRWQGLRSRCCCGEIPGIATRPEYGVMALHGSSGNERLALLADSERARTPSGGVLVIAGRLTEMSTPVGRAPHGTACEVRSAASGRYRSSRGASAGSADVP